MIYRYVFYALMHVRKYLRLVHVFNGAFNQKPKHQLPITLTAMEKLKKKDEPKRHFHISIDPEEKGVSKKVVYLVSFMFPPDSVE